MKRFLLFFVAVTLITCNTTVSLADNTAASAVSQRKIMIYLKPDVTVELSGAKQTFRDGKGQALYPIIYNGCTYLPIRAVSSLIKEPIEWDSGSKTVFIGKTLSNPNKTSASILETKAVAAADNSALNRKAPASSMVSAYLKTDILVMYDFVIQVFRDINGDVIYPINYNGSTYLPIRSISGMLNRPIEWNGTTQTVSIGSAPPAVEPSQPQEEPKEEPKKDPKEETKKDPVVVTTGAIKLKHLYDREEALYYEATAKATMIRNAATLDEKNLIAAAITDNYNKAQALTREINAFDQTTLTPYEKVAYEKLKTYAESTEHYMLVLENIAYLAAADSDYSMLAETFLYFAMDSQAKMEEARNAIQSLK